MLEYANFKLSSDPKTQINMPNMFIERVDELISEIESGEIKQITNRELRELINPHPYLRGRAMYVAMELIKGEEDPKILRDLLQLYASEFTLDQEVKDDPTDAKEIIKLNDNYIKAKEAYLDAKQNFDELEKGYGEYRQNKRKTFVGWYEVEDAKEELIKHREEFKKYDRILNRQDHVTKILKQKLNIMNHIENLESKLKD